MIYLFLMIPGILLSVSSLVGLYRNNRVYKMRIAMYEKIFSYTDYKWRLEMSLSVDYGTQVSQFWKPVKLESWYKDLSFLEPSTKPVLSFMQPVRNE